jgi:hypothetical protein
VLGASSAARHSLMSPGIGVEHEGTPAGKIETIGGVRSYVATPSGEHAKEKVLLLLTDIFGLELVNGQASALVTTFLMSH